MTARQILDLIASKHSEDVFVPECKDGATIFGSHFRLDAWAMKRSWANPMTTGYEIKVSRSDFLRDDKIPAYADLCNRLYLVAPAGVIDPSELPDFCGLLVPASTGTRLFTKRKAPYRKIEEPALLYKYLLMSRATITPSRYAYHVAGSDRSYWERWIETREADREFGRRLGGAIREAFDREVTRVQEINKNVRRENEKLAEIREVLDDMGLSPRDYWSLKENVQRRIEAVRSGITGDMREALEQAKRTSRVLAERIEQLEQVATKEVMPK
ncbi:MAG: MmcB family DNA repair protein [Spirochaetota bacterium]